jgi:hypothetical protein
VWYSKWPKATAFHIGFHAQAPLRILELAPHCPVTMNNVTFYPEDIQALFAQFYDGFNLNPIFAGAINIIDTIDPLSQNLMGTADQKILLIEMLIQECTFGPWQTYLTVANMVGMQKRPFIQDLDSGPEVWNYGVGQYNITSLERFTLEEGAQKFWNVTK